MKKTILRCAKYYWTFVSPFFYRKNRPQNSQNHILITKFDGLGDFFLLIPFLQQLLKINYQIVIISPSINKEITDHLNMPLTFIPFDNSSAGAFNKLLKYVRTTPFTHAFNLSMNIWGGFLVNQSKAVYKIGLLQEREYYVYKGANLFYDKILSYDPETHGFDVLVNVFKEISKSSGFIPFINSTASSGENVVIHPFATWAPRQWPHFLSLIESLAGKGYKVEIIGTSKEHHSFTLPDHLQNNHNINRTVLFSVRELMSRIDHCKAFIGNDSGPAHYAALIGKPSTVIWGPGFFERIHPKGKNVHFCILPMDCRPCRQVGKSCKRGKNICLQNITVDMVMNKFEKSIGVI